MALLRWKTWITLLIFLPPPPSLIGFYLPNIKKVVRDVISLVTLWEDSKSTWSQEFMQLKRDFFGACCSPESKHITEQCNNY